MVERSMPMHKYVHMYVNDLHSYIYSYTCRHAYICIHMSMTYFPETRNQVIYHVSEGLREVREKVSQSLQDMVLTHDSCSAIGHAQ
jgi:hypothetical protein